MHQAPPPKNTPGRRRPGRNGTSQRNYASENDIPTYRQSHANSPATPQKAADVKPSQSTNTKQRSRNANKGRNKNGAALPALINHNSSNNVKHDQPSPSFPPSQPPAFAGATFHNSPLPSALPIPSFLARTTSAPDSPSQRPTVTGPSQEPSPPTTDSEDGGPQSPGEPVERNEESPLEFFFKADRAEKARTRRASSANAAAIAVGPFSPPHDSPEECNTFPRPTGPVHTRRPNASQRHSGAGIPANELDGTPGEPFGQPFSTPYQERIRAARSNNSSNHHTATAQTKSPVLSEDLKRYLFSAAPGNITPQRTPPRQPAPSRSQAAQKLPRGMFPASVLTGNTNISQPGQTQTANSMDPHADRMRRMEDSLRRALKLNSST